MGIRNINEAVCDCCGKVKRSTAKQSDFLKTLKLQGWRGTITTIKCPECAKVEMLRIGRVKHIDGVYYVMVLSDGEAGASGGYAFIPYTEFMDIGTSTIPSATSEGFKNACRQRGVDADAMKIPKAMLIWPPEWKRIAAKDADGKESDKYIRVTKFK